MSIIEYSGVTREFGKKKVLHGIDLKIDEPCIYGLVGRNGAGKSTLLKMIPCLLHATKGSVTVFNKDPWENQDELKQKIGYLADNDLFPMTLRIEEFLDYNKSVYRKWDETMEAELLQRFKLKRDAKISTLSKGQKRQFALISILCFHPEVLILDEPAAGLDPAVRQEFLQLVLERLGSAGITVVFSSHHFADIERLANRVGILHEGRLIEDASFDDYHKKYCKVIGEIDADALEKIRAQPEFISVKDSCDLKQVTLKLSLNDVEQWAAGVGGIRIMDHQPVGLEELFIELTGKELEEISQ